MGQTDVTVCEQRKALLVLDVVINSNCGLLWWLKIRLKKKKIEGLCQVPEPYRQEPALKLLTSGKKLEKNLQYNVSHVSLTYARFKYIALNFPI